MTEHLPFSPSATFKHPLFSEVLQSIKPFSVVTSYFNVSYACARNWRRRSKVPCKHWKQFAVLSQRYGFSHTFQEIVALGRTAGLKERTFSNMAPDTNYHELRIKLLKSCRKLARNGDELEDAVQAGLVTYMETYDGDDSKHAFTYAYRCVVNALRRSRWKRDKEIMRSDEQWLTLEGVPESVRIDTLPHAPSTESIVCGKDDFLFALAEINQIPARPKLMLVLYGLGFEYKEVARLTGVKTGTVSSRINEARSLLGRSSTHEIKGDHKMLRRSFPDSEALLTWALDQCANKSPAHYARLTDNESGTSATDDAKETGKTMDDNT